MVKIDWSSQNHLSDGFESLITSLSDVSDSAVFVSTIMPFILVRVRVKEYKIMKEDRKWFKMNEARIVLKKLDQ